MMRFPLFLLGIVLVNGRFPVNLERSICYFKETEVDDATKLEIYCVCPSGCQEGFLKYIFTQKIGMCSENPPIHGRINAENILRMTCMQQKCTWKASLIEGIGTVDLTDGDVLYVGDSVPMKCNDIYALPLEGGLEHTITCTENGFHITPCERHPCTWEDRFIEMIEGTVNLNDGDVLNYGDVVTMNCSDIYAVPLKKGRNHTMTCTEQGFLTTPCERPKCPGTFSYANDRYDFSLIVVKTPANYSTASEVCPEGLLSRNLWYDKTFRAFLPQLLDYETSWLSDERATKWDPSANFYTSGSEDLSSEFAFLCACYNQ